MRIRTLLVILLVVSWIYGQTQSVHVGLTTGGNATFVLDKGLTEDPRYNSTFTFGATPIGFNFGVDFGSKFGLSLESILSKQGQIYEIIDVAKSVSGERKIDLSYLHLPLLMRFMSGGNSSVRSNFNVGPQLSILTDAVESIQTNAGVYEIPEGVTFDEVREELAPSPADYDKIQQIDANSYEVTEDLQPKELLTKKANQFANTEFQIAAAFGLDFDLSRHLFMSTQIRANYSITDMRNGDVIETIKNGQAGSLFGKRSNLLIGLQIGLHYTFGLTPSKKGTEKRN